MQPEVLLDMKCSQCGMELRLRYREVRQPPASQHVMGCPECQSTGNIAQNIEKLEESAAPRHLEILALEKRTEVGVGSATPPHVGTPPTLDAAGQNSKTSQRRAAMMPLLHDEPRGPSVGRGSTSTAAKKATKRAEAAAATRQEENRHEEDAVNDNVEDAEDARQDAQDAAADNGN